MENRGKRKREEKEGPKSDYSSSSASKNDETVVVETTKHETQTHETEVCATVVVETTTHETQTQPSTGEAVTKLKSQSVDETEVCATGAPDLPHEDMEIDYATPMEIDLPMREPFQLPQESLKELFSSHICRIDETQIEKLFGDVILDRIRSRPCSDGKHFACCDGVVDAIAWQTTFRSDWFRPRFRGSWRKLFGPIRNQFGHLLCWDYSSTDLVSAESQLKGWETEYHPLSAWHLCMSCRPDRLGMDEKAPKDHLCYGYLIDAALQHMKDSGIPPREEYSEFMCNRYPVPFSSSGGKIEVVCRFDKLEDAMFYLQLGPIGADLIVYSKLFWERDDIYYGMLEKNVCFDSYHAVIIESIERYRGDWVAVCRMSNGTNVGHGGYVYVSLTTMYLIVKVASNKIPYVRHTPAPQHLLSNFALLRMHERKDKNAASSSKPQENEEVKLDSKSAQCGAPSLQPQLQDAKPEYFKEKENLWKAAFPVGTEWDQQDAVYEVNWDFKNVEEALEEGGKLHGKKVYVFGCIESQLVKNKTVIVPTVVCIVSTIPPSDKIGVASVQGQDEEIISMKDMNLDWLPYTPLEKRGRQVDKMDVQIFTLQCTESRSALKLLKEDHVKKFNYCLPYIDNPFKEDESEQSTVVQITFPSEPPVVCEYDWAIDNLEELTDDLIKKETLLMDRKDEFNEFVKGKSDKAKTAYEEAKQAREKAKEGMSEETKEAYKEMKLYKFYTLPSPETPDVTGINKSLVINKYLGKAHEVV